MVLISPKFKTFDQTKKNKNKNLGHFPHTDGIIL